jgi:putative copper resistance protein D
VGGTAPGVNLGVVRATLVAAVVVTGTVTAGWALAHPALPLAITTVRALADGAAVLTLGLATAPLLESPRYRDQLLARCDRLMGWAAGGWLLLEALRLALATAAAVAVPLTEVSVATMSRFAAVTAPGRSALFGICAGAILVCLVSWPHRSAGRSPVWTTAAITTAGIGVAARTVSGHLGESAWGGAAVASHALAAALWCGVLAALALTVTSRGQWARVLPVFSRLALWSAGVVLLAGTVAAATAIAAQQNSVDLLGTGYGRILLAKVGVTAGLLWLAWRNRTGWLDEARRHRVSAQRSLARAATELIGMGVALTFAAALSVTG